MNQASRARLTATIITLNAAAQLPECLASVAFADEVVVADSGSTDGTREIAERLGISQMHVSRLLARALGHLKSRLLDSAGTDTPHSAATA